MFCPCWFGLTHPSAPSLLVHLQCQSSYRCKPPPTSDAPSLSRTPLERPYPRFKEKQDRRPKIPSNSTWKQTPQGLLTNSNVNCSIFIIGTVPVKIPHLILERERERRRHVRRRCKRRLDSKESRRRRHRVFSHVSLFFPARSLEY